MDSRVSTIANVIQVVRALIRAVRISLHCLVVAVGYLVLALLAYGVLESACMWADSVVRRRNVRELASLSGELEPGTDENEPGDFNGDGVVDELRVEYERVEPLFNWVTSGMIYLESGQTGETIMTHRLDAPFLRGGWCGDYDDDGLPDVVLETRDGWTVFGFDGEGR